jgi:hypothetical protein
LKAEARYWPFSTELELIQDLLMLHRICFYRRLLISQRGPMLLNLKYHSSTKGKDYTIRSKNIR